MKKILITILLSVIGYGVNAQYTMPIRHVHTGFHFVGGFGIGSLGSMVGNTPKKRLLYGVGLGTAAGVTKELYDVNRGGKFSASDVFFTTAGSVVGSLVINWAFKRSNKRK